MQSFLLLHKLGVKRHLKEKADVPHGSLVPVKWTCERCPAVLLGLRMICWQERPGEVACWPFVHVPYRTLVEGKCLLEIREHTQKTNKHHLLWGEHFQQGENNTSYTAAAGIMCVMMAKSGHVNTYWSYLTNSPRVTQFISWIFLENIFIIMVFFVCILSSTNCLLFTGLGWN